MIEEEEGSFFKEEGEEPERVPWAANPGELISFKMN